MKDLKIKLAAMAILLGIGSAFATVTPHRTDLKRWGKYPSGLYTEVTGDVKGTDYFCNGMSSICTEEYPADVDPNNQLTDDHAGIASPVNSVIGTFSN